MDFPLAQITMLKRQLPNTITLVNLFSGCMVLISIMEDAYWGVWVWFAIGLLADFLDGAVARALGVTSPLGEQLDSLADLVSFGVVPSMLLYDLLFHHQINALWWYPVAFLVAVFSALRLARFNLKSAKELDFKGLPTPANAVLILGIWTSYQAEVGWVYGMIHSSNWLLALFIIVDCWLLVSNIRFIGLKFRDFSWVNNWSRYVLVLLSAILILIFQTHALTLVVLLYIGFSILVHFIKQ